MATQNERKKLDDLNRSPGRLCQEIDGIRITAAFDKEILRSALQYKARPDDIFIVCYPKCGTTWMQDILYLLFNNGQYQSNREERLANEPFLEIHGAQACLNMKRPNAIKTHLPFDRVPYNSQAKYICLSRNIKDVCVSLYHHIKARPRLQFEVDTFDEYFELFMIGEVPHGDYFDHLFAIWNHRNDPNVIVLLYEQMQQDIQSTIKKLAQFLGEKYTKMLDAEPQLLDRIAKLSSFTYLETNNIDVLPFRGDRRKGKVNGWKEELTPEQSKRLDQLFAEKTKDLPELNKYWSQYTTSIEDEPFH
ncbi:unnamed protein product [Rotaria sp. Silwood1]|nr:unnamed protein product [Rotaria sp. Silwood1]